MAWIYLLIAGMTEIIWAIGLKEAQGFSVLLPSIVTLVFIIVSFFLFAKAMETIPIGTAYAIFTGIGAAGTAIVGIVLFNEGAGVGKLFFLDFCLSVSSDLNLLMDRGRLNNVLDNPNYCGAVRSAFVIMMKLSEGFRNKKYTALTVLTAVLSFFLLSVAMK